MNLRKAASIIFALAALLPLLAMLPVLRRSGVLDTTEGQVSLLGALLLAVLGFVVLRLLVGRIASLAGAMTAPAPAAASAAATAAAPVPGLGRVAEIGQIGGAFARMLKDLRASTERLQDVVVKLSALNELVELAARIPQMPDILSLVLERTMSTVGATSGSIMIADPARRVLRVVAARGGSVEVVPGVEMPIGRGVAGRVAETGEAVVGDESICLPVRVEDRTIGVVSVATSADGAGEARAFGPTDLQFLNTLMTHVAYALDNARLLQEARLSAERLGHAVEELRAAQTRVVEGETLRAMGQMASGMAHHLNNLLSVVSGRTQLLLRKVQEPEIRGPLEVVQRATDDAADVVRRVLGFTAVRPVSRAARVDLNEIVSEVIEFTRPRWQDQAHLRGVAIDVVLRLGEIPRVAGEGVSLREVVMNLLLNAVDALPRGGTITITTDMAEGWVACSVADDGVGMADEVRRHAFEPFFTTKGSDNTGLGLSVAHGIVQRHGGELEIRSAAGRGAVVTLRLPPAEPGAEDEVPLATAPPPSLTILLIEDEARVRVALADALAALGHAVLQAPGGRDGLEQIERGARVDVVITDLGMPGMNGWEVARAVKARWPDLPVGLVTGWTVERELTREEVERVDFVIAKPYTLEGLHATLAPFRPGADQLEAVKRPPPSLPASTRSTKKA